MQVIPDDGDQHLGARALVEIGIANLLCEWNDLDGAIDHMNKGMTLVPKWEKADDLALAYVTLTRIHLAQENSSEATKTIEKAIHLVQTRGVFSEARQEVENAQIKIWLAQGDLQAVNRWIAAQDERINSDDLMDFDNELAQIARARILAAMDKFGDAIGLLSHLEKNAQSGGRTGRLIEIMLLKALVLQKMGDHRQAVNILTKSLSLAEPEGYVRVFLDEGQTMRMLLSQWLEQTDTDPLRKYVNHLLSYFTAGPQEKTKSLANSDKDLVEPLSTREQEVLKLIALGKTNQEIAEQLVVARGTIKAHAASIYRKLDVTNRTEAVARARQLNILS